MADVSPAVEMTAVPSKRQYLKRQREADSEDDDEPRHFRRVRIRCRQRTSLSVSGDGTLRCVCGAQENLGENRPDSAPLARLATTWLIQCVHCKFWQHRSCVGTANGNDPPRGYYCEQCSKPKASKPKASEGDAVLLSHMGAWRGLESPDLAARLLENPISLIGVMDDSDNSTDMDDGDPASGIPAIVHQLSADNLTLHTSHQKTETLRRFQYPTGQQKPFWAESGWPTSRVHE